MADSLASRRSMSLDMAVEMCGERRGSSCAAGLADGGETGSDEWFDSKSKVEAVGLGDQAPLWAIIPICSLKQGLHVAELVRVPGHVSSRKESRSSLIAILTPGVPTIRSLSLPHQRSLIRLFLANVSKVREQWESSPSSSPPSSP
jgi:hypothetical protein